MPETRLNVSQNTPSAFIKVIKHMSTANCTLFVANVRISVAAYFE